MNLTRYSLLFCCLLSLCVLPLHAQDAFVADTSLTYAQFLNECREFSRESRDEVWVVAFWASYDNQSLYALEALIAAEQNYRMKPVRFVGISTDYKREGWEYVLSRYEMPWEQLWLKNNTQDYEFLKRAFKHSSLPAIFIVDTEARIRHVVPNELPNWLATETRSLPNRPYGAQTNAADNLFEENPPAAGDPEIEIIPLPGNEPEASEPDPLPSPETNPGSPLPGWVTHTVRKGETLFSLYRRYGVKVDEIKRINGLRSNLIKPGQVLKIKAR